MNVLPALQPRRAIVILGTKLTVNWLWVVITCVIAGITLESLAPERSAFPLIGWYVLAGLVVLGIIASLIAHQAAHIWMARRVGCSVRSFEPALLGNLSDAAFPPSTPRIEALVASAGAAVSGALALGLLLSSLALRPASETIAAGLTVLGFANLVILALSLVPGFPFDGGRALRAFIWYLSDDLIVGTRVAAFYAQFLSVFGFVLALAALAAGDPYSVWGAWGILFLWAMHRASHDGLERTIWIETAKITTVGDVVMGATTRISADATIDAAIDEVLNALNHGPILVTEGGQISGVFSLSRIRRVPRAIWTERLVREVAASIDELPRIGADAPATELLELFSATGAELVLVEASDDGRILGALDQEVAEQRLRDRISSERRRRRNEQ